jgi:ABC-2 type transport system ATP-binding protein
MIKVENLTKNYGNFKALKSISFEVEKGVVFGFIGRNGAGKTTTMNILTGLIGFNSGKIIIDGNDLTRNKGELSKYIGYLPEAPAFYDFMNSYEYLDLIAGLLNTDSQQKKKRVEELLEMVRLKKDAKRKIGGYSRGMKQRLALAVAIFNKPPILFLDEPSSALDPEGRREMLGLIEELKDKDTTIFLSTHILSDAERVCDTICMIDEGKILLTESLEGLYRKHMHPVFDIEFESKPEKEIDILKELDWVKSINPAGNRLSLEVSDMEKAKAQTLKILSGLANNVTSYQIRKMKLEDIFIGTVRDNADI